MPPDPVVEDEEEAEPEPPKELRAEWLTNLEAKFKSELDAALAPIRSSLKALAAPKPEPVKSDSIPQLEPVKEPQPPASRPFLGFYRRQR